MTRSTWRSRAGPATVLASAIAVGCYASDGPPGAGRGTDAGRVGTDGGGDATTDGDYVRGDCGVSADGLPRCHLFDRRCGGCLCWGVGEGDERHGVCLTDPDDPRAGELCTVASGCARRGSLCHDLGNTATEGKPLEGVCVSTDVCDILRRRGDESRCYYEDGTAYETGEVPESPCRVEHEEVICGPGCGECASGRDCFGISERSGLGLCMNAPVPSSIDRCGVDYDECLEDESCVRLVVPPTTPVPASEVSGACVSTGVCRELAREYPERFRCPEG